MLSQEILTLKRISVGDPAASKKRILEHAAQLLAADDGKPGVETIFDRLLERERLGSTGLSGGVALPHARMPGLDRTVGAFMRLEQAVDFDASDGQAVDLVFALLVPEQATQEHLDLLARLARLFSDPQTRARLRSADAASTLQLLTEATAHDAA